MNSMLPKIIIFSMSRKKNSTIFIKNIQGGYLKNWLNNIWYVVNTIAKEETYDSNIESGHKKNKSQWKQCD